MIFSETQLAHGNSWGQIRLVDAKKARGLARPNANTHSKNAANINKCLYINHLTGFFEAWLDFAVAKSLQVGGWIKSLWDQSLAQRCLAMGVAISFHCSAFSTGGGRF
ncbi:hypothetical protein EMIT043CA1_10409 [Pseudomonas brassicacearum]